MKKTLLYSAMAVATLTMSSCGDDFLMLDPVGSVSESTLLTPQGVDMVLNGAYATLYAPGRDYFATPFSNYAYGDVFGGDANKGSEASDQSDFTQIETYSFNSSNGYLLSKWRYLYDGIKNANNVQHMALLIEDQLEPQDFNYIMGQAAFLRGLYHFEAAKQFGAAVPYVDLEAFEVFVDPAVSNVDENGNYIYIWDKIAADFEFASNNLPEAWPSAPGRVNKAAALAFLAKTYIYMASPWGGVENGANKSDYWTRAKSTIEQILNNPNVAVDSKGNSYKLADTYEALWTAGMSDWTGESVFDIQTAIAGTNTYPNSLNGTSHIAMAGAIGGGWGFFQPSVYFVSSHKVDASGLPVADLGGTLSAPNKVKEPDMDDKTGQQKVDEETGELLWKDVEYIVTDLSVFTDPRLEYSTGRFGVPFWDWGTPKTVDGWVRSTSNAGYYLNKKYMPKKADKGSLSLETSTGSTAKNTHVMRVADLYLLYAETCIETGDLTTAREYVNKVRARAANSFVKADATTSGSYVFEDLVHGTTVPGAAGNYRLGLWPESAFSTKEAAKKALMDERHIELGLEGQRWYDLARWGEAPSVVNGFIAYESDYLVKYKGASYQNNWICFPIPNSEIVTMQGKLVQNAVWK